MYKVAPLTSGFMLTSIIGFLISMIYIYQKVSQTWGFAFALIFAAMFFASMVSLSKAPLRTLEHDRLLLKTGEPKIGAEEEKIEAEFKKEASKLK